MWQILANYHDLGNDYHAYTLLGHWKSGHAIKEQGVCQTWTLEMFIKNSVALIVMIGGFEILAPIALYCENNLYNSAC